MIRIGKLRQAVMSEGISSLCFCYGKLGHKQENYCYRVRPEEKDGAKKDAPGPKDSCQGDQLDPNYGPWMLVKRRKNYVRNG